jgi:hypothetical protein
MVYNILQMNIKRWLKVPVFHRIFHFEMGMDQYFADIYISSVLRHTVYLFSIWFS